ncbi:MAG: AbrB/MazE/SpoVT family DNA-binding domain-containing protein [Candidatus Altimarinota bacterium]
MSKIVQATERGQITLPKKWRDQFETQYYTTEIRGNELVLRPLVADTLAKDVETSWQEYQHGHFVTQEDLMKKYGL